MGSGHMIFPVSPMITLYLSFKELGPLAGKCAYSAAHLESLSQYLQTRYAFSSYGLPEGLKSKIIATALLGAEAHVEFQVRVTDWLGSSKNDAASARIWIKRFSRWCRCRGVIILAVTIRCWPK